MGTKELEKKSSGGGLVAAWKQNPLVSTGLVLILMIVVQTAIMIYNFGEGSVGELLLSLLTNWLNILRNNAPVGIIALGMTFVIISGGIDLSVGSTLVAVGAMVMMVVDGSATGLLAGMGSTGVPAYIIAIAVGLVFGALLGWLNGVDDNAICIYRMSGGAIGTMTASWTYYGAEDNSTVLYGTKGILRIYDDPAYSLKLITAGGEKAL